MRRMRLGPEAIGQALAEPPTDATGRPLAPRGKVVDEELRRRLQEAGVQIVFVEDPAFSDLQFSALVSPPTMRLASAVFHEAKERLQSRPKDPLPYVPFLHLAQAVIQDSFDTPLDVAAVLLPQNQAQRDEIHALNRASLAVRLTQAMRLPRYAADLAAAGLACDLGMLVVPPELRWRHTELTPEEVETIRGHVAASVHCVEGREGWSAVTRAAIAQHHERMDGSGYPNRVKGDEIHPTARILAVCDVFCAMLLPRPDRGIFSPEEALAEVDGAAGSLFDYDTVVAFHRMVPPYPVGTEVELSTGERAVVLRVPGSLKARPLVRVFMDKDGTRLTEFPEMDLTQRELQATTVVRVIA